MEFQIVRCSSGHKLKAKAKLFGRTCKCPECGKPVEIPLNPPQQVASKPFAKSDSAKMAVTKQKPKNQPAAKPAQKKEIFDDASVLDILGASNYSAPPEDAEEKPELRTCLSCGCDIRASYAVCPYCQCFLGRLNDE